MNFWTPHKFYKIIIKKKTDPPWLPTTEAKKKITWIFIFTFSTASLILIIFWNTFIFLIFYFFKYFLGASSYYIVSLAIPKIGVYVLVYFLINVN